MKKILYALICLVLFSLIGNAQEDVIVLVDVSKSIRQNHFTQAREVVKNILLGNPVGNTNFHVDLDRKTFIKIGGGKSLVSKGKKLLIMPFGETRWMNGYFKPKTINYIPSDINSYFESKYPKNVTDNRTYLKLALAKAAQTAKSQGMDKYIQIVVSDNINDDYGGPNTKPVYSSTQRHLVENFATLSNPYVAPKHGEVNFDLDPNYKIRIFHVDVSKWSYSLPSSIMPGTPKDSICALKFTSFANGKKGKEKSVKNNPVTFRWSAKNYPQGTKFTLSIKSTTGNKKNNITKSVTSNLYKIDLADDTYRVSISSPICVSDTTYIKVDAESGGGGFFLFLLLLAVLSGLGYWLYKRNQEKKIDESTVNYDNDSTAGETSTQGAADELDGF